MDGMDARRESDRALRKLAIARGEMQNRLTAALAFRAALSGKEHGLSPDAGQALAGLSPGVLRARRHELETSLRTLQALEESVEAARRAVARAERAWLAERRARPGQPRRGA